MLSTSREGVCSWPDTHPADWPLPAPVELPLSGAQATRWLPWGLKRLSKTAPATSLKPKAGASTGHDPTARNPLWRTPSIKGDLNTCKNTSVFRRNLLRSDRGIGTTKCD